MQGCSKDIIYIGYRKRLCIYTTPLDTAEYHCRCLHLRPRRRPRNLQQQSKWGGSSLGLWIEMPKWRRRAAVTEHSCVPSAYVSIYTCVYLHSPPLSHCWFCKYSYLVQILEERGHTLPYQQHNWARKIVSGCYTSLMWKRHGSGQTDSSMREPFILAWVPQYCIWVTICPSAEKTYGHNGNWEKLQRWAQTCASRDKLSGGARLYLGRKSGVRGAGDGEDWELQHRPRLMLHSYLLVT